jgi:hypothetical protein
MEDYHMLNVVLDEGDKIYVQNTFERELEDQGGDMKIILMNVWAVVVRMG